MEEDVLKILDFQTFFESVNSNVMYSNLLTFPSSNFLLFKYKSK